MRHHGMPAHRTMMAGNHDGWQAPANGGQDPGRALAAAAAGSSHHKADHDG
jgi:hypothetical protein